MGRYILYDNDKPVYEAVTLCDWVMVRLMVGCVLVMSPLHPVKVSGAFGTAVSVFWLPAHC